MPWTEDDFKVMTLRAIENIEGASADLQKAFPFMSQGEAVIGALLAEQIHRHYLANKDPDDDAPWKGQ